MKWVVILFSLIVVVTATTDWKIPKEAKKINLTDINEEIRIETMLSKPAVLKQAKKKLGLSETYRLQKINSAVYIHHLIGKTYYQANVTLVRAIIIHSHLELQFRDHNGGELIDVRKI